MDDVGGAKDDVRLPEGEVGEKINKLFKVEEKDVSKCYDEANALHESTLTVTIQDVTVQTAMGEEAAVDAKESTMK